MKKLLKTVVLFLCMVAFCTPIFAKNVGITVISDVHLSSDKQNNKMTDSVRNLLEAIKQANADTSDCVVFLGDNVQGTERVDFAMFGKIINKLKKPCFVLLGNRDVSRNKNINKKEALRIINKFSKNRVTKLPVYKKYDDLIFIFMAGVNETFPTYRGYYKKDELVFLDDTLTKFKDKKVIIFQHFPVIPPTEDENRATVKPQDYLDVLHKHDNVLAVVSGHYHKENITEDDYAVKHISAPGLCATGEYEQIKIFKNKNGTYSITTKILSVE